MGNSALNKIILLIFIITLFVIIGASYSHGQCKKFIQVTHVDSCSRITLDENTWTEFYMAKKKLDTISPLVYQLDSINKRLVIENKTQSLNINSKVRFCEYKNTEYQTKITTLEKDLIECNNSNSSLSKKVSTLKTHKIIAIGIIIITISLTLIR
jgi:subtilase family serine protease